jgi:hypothetical protein
LTGSWDWNYNYFENVFDVWQKERIKRSTEAVSMSDKGSMELFQVIALSLLLSPFSKTFSISLSKAMERNGCHAFLQQDLAKRRIGLGGQ